MCSTPCWTARGPVGEPTTIHGSGTGWSASVFPASSPAAHGGAGAGAVEISLVAEAMGAHLVAEPFLSTVLAVQTLLALGDERASARYLPLIARGELLATVALDLDLRATAEPIWARRTPDGDCILTGTAGPVLDAPAAELIICLATDGTAVSAFAVDPLASGVRVDFCRPSICTAASAGYGSTARGPRHSPATRWPPRPERQPGPQWRWRPSNSGSCAAPCR